jgi:hypothetical protein
MIDVLKAQIKIDVTPDLYTNQTDPSIKITLESVSFTLKLNTTFKKGGASLATFTTILANREEDLSSEAQSKINKGFYQHFTRSFKIDL